MRITTLLGGLGLLGILLAPAPLQAGPRDPVTVTRPPEGQGASFVPGTRLVSRLPKREYVEEEFFVEGRARLFNYGHNPPLGPTDLVVQQDAVPYRTRLIVRRPADPAEFDGTVIVEWWNSTAGFDTAPVWDPSAEYFARKGVAYVGVTNSTTSIGFLTGGCRAFGILPPSCGTRYAGLSLPDNGLAFEMMQQISNAIRRESTLLPGAYAVRRILHAGESQQAGSVITYATAFHFPGLSDGYFIQSGINARAINFGPRCGDAGAPAFPACTPRLVYPQTLVRTDLPVPVYQVVTQTDFETLGFGTAGRQSDTARYRYYEIAGAGHNTVHRNVEILPAGLLGPQPLYLDDLCANELNTVADGPVYASHVLNALWHRMIRQTITGAAPPRGRLMDDTAGVLRRDANGNVTGGIRVPAMAAPVARYGSTNVADPSLPGPLIGLGNLACRLSGSVFRFDGPTRAALYPTPQAYLGAVESSVDSLLSEGLMLRSDADRVLRAAERYAERL